MYAIRSYYALVAFLSASNTAFISAYSPEDDEDDEMSLQIKHISEDDDDDEGTCI